MGSPGPGPVADTGLFAFSMWAWCGQQSSNSEQTVQQYLDALDALEQSYPSMRFIYMTGHTDGGSTTLIRNSNLVRDYVRAQRQSAFRLRRHRKLRPGRATTIPPPPMPAIGAALVQRPIRPTV